MGYVYIFITVIFTVYGQLILKWRLNQLELPDSFLKKIFYLLRLLLDPFIFSSFFLGLLSQSCMDGCIEVFSVIESLPLHVPLLHLCSFLKRMAFS